MTTRAARHYSGLGAEDTVQRLYEADGATTLAARWSCPAGEIDLIFAQDSVTIFVEVKQRRSLEEAAAAISARQWARIGAAAQAFLVDRGLALETDMRFDAALLDRSGGCQIIKNANMF